MPQVFPGFMAVNGPSTLVPTINFFLQHWALANGQSASARPLKVLDNLDREDLFALRDVLQHGPSALNSAIKEELFAHEALVVPKKRLISAMKNHHGLIRGHFPDSRWQRLLAALPQFMARPAVWRPTFYHTTFCWRKVALQWPNAYFVIDADFTRYSAEDFAVDLQKLEAAYIEMLECEAVTALAQAEWDISNEQAMEMMKAYGHAVKARFGNSHPLSATLPQLWPGPKRGDRRKRALT